VTLRVRLIGPVQLLGGTTPAAATEAITARARAWLAATSTFDLAGFAEAVRDDAAYALVLEECALVLERDGRFEQLVLGSAPRPVEAQERPELTGIELEVGS
jgi:hypothetical protein